MKKQKTILIILRICLLYKNNFINFLNVISLNISNLLTSIKYVYFFLCKGLTVITLTYSITLILFKCFDDCQI
jgi:hypothetical protein